MAPPPKPVDLRRLREMAGLSRMRAAARASVSDETARLYETDRLAVAVQARARLDAVYLELRERVAHELVGLVCRTHPLALASTRPPLALARARTET